MKPSTIRVLTVIISLIVLASSLMQSAVKVDYQGVKLVVAIDYFLMGSTAILGGGLFEQIIWMANPISLYAIILLFKNNRKAIKYSILALVLSLSFSMWDELLGAESGAMAKIVSLEVGYYLWVLSIAILVTGILFYFKNADSDLPDNDTHRILASLRKS